MRILLVEDDERISRDVAKALRMAGYVVDTVANGEEAWFLGDTENFAAVILDLGLPGLDGLAVLERWREQGRRTPVLALSARGSWSERVAGIDAGADDYLPKPFRLEELLARLRSIIRRSAGHASSVTRNGALSLDERSMTIKIDDAPVELTAIEYRVVAYLLHRRGLVVPQSELAEHVYGHDQQSSNAVETLIGRVRKKLGAEVIETRRGFGYLIPELDA
ncbi:response regulator transcription factor [Methylosinus sp. Ce-a6]|uniref:response regulator transcription factor n=1 Tax=Methylosinus sp. Ce-a6 TaxID=2172005 RepID=UPI00135751EC|nr:response regulator transcription factor [Methylosinus sp. Ce-a6]